MSADATPSWVLISVLFSTFPLEEDLALALHRVALDLYRSNSSAGLVDHGLAHGQVKNANKEAVVGSITGPVFEAELETERGKGEVRFILTRQGLDLLEARGREPKAGPRYLN
ncbi:MAG: hypothetical protein DI536_17005 [Archangium gephyra]|uniref:Uncharacterized protein n=1 Tax=Archangium gephyra TaxID=48 RepID=A0A2W5T928_9BACT|nr:MAG: hypothetical protein DI536_17005 [Archangium gephyra]